MELTTFQDYFLLTEKKGTTEYGCLMAVFPKAEGKKFINFAHKHIDKKNTCNDGYENEPHVTVLYGFHGNLAPKLVPLLAQWGPLCGTLGKVSRFKGDERDVLKVEVKSPCFKKMHKFLMDNFKKEITTSFPEWNGHITLAYVEPGTHKELDGNTTFVGEELSFLELTYSTPGMHKKIKFSIEGDNCSC